MSLRQRGLKEYFGRALFCATVIPFLIACFRCLNISKNTDLGGVFYILATALATIHVPLTVYLFFDPSIRNQIRTHPVRFIAVPALLFALCLFVFLGTTQSRMGQNVTFTLYFMLGVLSWNYWHFGKQNIGVYAYYRLSTSTGRMLPIEKKLMYLGAFLGAISVSFLGLRFYRYLNAPIADFDHWIYLSGYVSVFGKYLQYALASFTLLHILRNRSRFDWKSALMFFLCVNYFLPAYLSLDDQRWITFYLASFYTHGIQYVAFLFFHSCNARHAIPVPNQRFSNRFIATHIYLIIFLLLAMALAFYTMPISLNMFIVDLHSTYRISDAYWMSLLNAVGVAILLNHFWFDSFFWKFSNKESRNWVLDRYNFLFKPAPLI